jgi:hypothetical protein
VQIGLVPSFNRPGSNVTGVVSMNTQLGAKRLGLLHELLPEATRFAAWRQSGDAETGFRERGGLWQSHEKATGGQSRGHSTRISALRFCIFVLAFSLVGALNATAATKAVKFGNLWDGHGTIANAIVIVENDKIQSVTAGGAIPAGAEIVDLSRYTGMPGMIDSHTHMTYYWDPGSGTDPRHQPPRHAAVTVFLSQANAMATTSPAFRLSLSTR